MTPFNIVLGFILFLIPIGVMLENSYELSTFQATLLQDIRSNEAMIISIKKQLEETSNSLSYNIKTSEAVRVERTHQIEEILSRIRAHDKVFEANGTDRLTRTEMQTWTREFFPLLPPLPKINSPNAGWHPPLLAPIQ